MDSKASIALRLPCTQKIETITWPKPLHSHYRGLHQTYNEMPRK